MAWSRRRSTYPRSSRPLSPGVASERSISEAELIREALSDKVSAAAKARPTVGLFAEGLGNPGLAERVDELLTGFGG